MHHSTFDRRESNDNGRGSRIQQDADLASFPTTCSSHYPACTSRSKRPLFLVVAAALLVALAAPAESMRMPPVPPGSATPTVVHDAIVVGAGWSGLKATSTLVAAGIENVLVLEARGYLGGRSRTVRDFVPGGLPVELGSAFVYLGSDLADFMDEEGIRYDVTAADIPDSSSFALYSYDSMKNSSDTNDTNSKTGGATTRRLGENETNALINRLWTGSSGFVPFVRKKAKKLRKRKKSDESYQDVLEEFEEVKGIGDDSIGRHFLKEHINTDIVLEYAADPDKVSIQMTGDDFGYPGGTASMEVPGGGFGNAAEALARPFRDKIRLGAEVVSINLERGDPVAVSYRERDGTPRAALGRTVLVTVPLGVLKSGRIAFTPRLPPYKRDIIDSMEVGTLNKCIMYWDDADDAIWPHDKEWLELITDEDETSGQWAAFFNPIAHNGGAPVLVGWIGGRAAAAMEDRTDEEVLEDVLANLRAMFGHTAVVPPTRYVVTRWGKDEFARGSYSVPVVGRDFNDDAMALRKRVGNVWFAGEATNDRGWAATTVGAWETGEKAGRSIVKALKEGRRGFGGQTNVDINNK